MNELHWLIDRAADAEIFVNGELVEEFSGRSVRYETRPLSQAAKNLLKPGKNRLSVHCHQTRGGQYIDVGLATQEEQ